jgi:hypothetical protein
VPCLLFEGFAPNSGFPASAHADFGLQLIDLLFTLFKQKMSSIILNSTVTQTVERFQLKKVYLFSKEVFESAICPSATTAVT